MFDSINAYFDYIIIYFIGLIERRILEILL